MGLWRLKNPVDVVARVFRTLLKNYNFQTVEFALATHNDLSNDAFAQAIKSPIATSSPEITTTYIDPVNPK